MNTDKPGQLNGTFCFRAVVNFEIDPTTASILLVESDSTKTVHDWICSQHVSSQDIPWSGNANNLKEALGHYLAEKEVSKAREALPSGDPRLLPF